MQEATGGTRAVLASVSPPVTAKEAADLLRHIIKAFYPHALSRPYCVPPVYFNRIPLRYKSLYGQAAFIQNPPSADPSPTTRGNPAVTPKRSTDGGDDGSRSGSSALKSSKMRPGDFSMWTQEEHLRLGQSLPTVPDFHMRADFAQQHVLINLQALAEELEEVMFIVSELLFKDYLNKPFYAKATSKLPTPRNVSSKGVSKQGDFDFLIITHDYGILVVELKSVGRSEAGREDADVAKKVLEALQQVGKSENVARELVADIAPNLSTKAAIFLPYVSREQLVRVLKAEEDKLGTMMCTAFNVKSIETAAELCLCADDVSNPETYWDVNEAVLSKLTAWWEKRMIRMNDDTGAATEKKNVLSDDQYLDIVGRFVGPATTVKVHCTVSPRIEVRTEGQAVSELGRRVARLVLTPQQYDLLHRSPPRVCLTGPPGTGKTLVMVMEGLRWLQEGEDVHLLNVDPANIGIAQTILNQLEMTAKSPEDETGFSSDSVSGKVYFHRYFITEEGNGDKDVDRAVEDLVKAAEAKPDKDFCVMLDEGVFQKSTPLGARHHRLLAELDRRLGQRLRFWMTGSSRSEVPEELQRESLTIPLRCAPVVVREVRSTFDLVDIKVDAYTENGVPFPGDGLKVVRLKHCPGKGHHTSRWPVNCRKCGLDVASELRRLGVGVSLGDAKATSSETSPAPLQYRDVFILTRSSELHDDVTSPFDEREVVVPASDFIGGLRDAGIPVCILGVLDRYIDETKWESGVQDTAVAKTDHVVVAHHVPVTGMERKVVVWMQGRNKRVPESKDKRHLKVMNSVDILNSMSRCTTQLLTVEAPLAGEAPSDKKDEDSDDPIWNELKDVDWEVLERDRNEARQLLRLSGAATGGGDSASTSSRSAQPAREEVCCCNKRC